MYDLYVSTTPVKEAIKAQDTIIKKIASKGSCVIVGRAAGYVLRDNKNLVKIFIYAKEDYRVKKVMEMYGDSKDKALKSIRKSDKARSNYYKTITNNDWYNMKNYDLCIDSSMGAEVTAKAIVNFVKNMEK